MPPRAKFSREEVIQGALDLVRREGMEGLTARGLAAALGSSPRPIFTLFEGMEEVCREVIRAAQKLYQGYLDREMGSGAYPPYKASGMGYIRFAQEEKELFKLLFMRDRSAEVIEENREEIRPLLELIQDKLGVDEDQAFLFHLEMWIYVHGIATMLATHYLALEPGFISQVLTDAFEGLRMRWLQRGKAPGAAAPEKEEG